MGKQISNKKFKTTVVSLCLGFLMVVGAVIGVWAASTQNYKAGFNISYSVGDNVAAKVRTEYYVPNADYDSNGVEDGAHTVTTNEAGDTVTGEDGYVTFNAGDSNETGAEVYIGDFGLTPQTPKVIFYFTIHNLIETDGSYIQVIVDETYTSRENVTVKTTYLNPESFTLTSSASTMSADDYTNKQYDNVSAQGYKIIRVEIAVRNQNKSASIEGDIGLGLYYHEKEQSVSILSFEKFYYYSIECGEANRFDYIQNKPSLATTGIDLSEEGDGSIWGKDSYILSYNTILLPANAACFFQVVMDYDSMYYPFYPDSFGMTEEEFMEMDIHRYQFQDRFIFNNLDTSQVTNMANLFSVSESGDYEPFEECLTTLDLSMFDTTNVTNYANMFAGRSIETVYIGDKWTLDVSEYTDINFIRV